MKVNIKKLAPNAVIPKYAKTGDAGMDLVATRTDHDKYGNIVCYTGLAMEIPDSHVGLLFPRSSISKTPMTLRNSVGVIDSGYRGEIIFKFKKEQYNDLNLPGAYVAGDRIGQIIIIPYPQIEFNEVTELSDSDRGQGGFGSTGS